ncbi:MAG: hypothetical protein RIF33_08405 [Cyclobacteriaceae bacterium]
MSTHRQHIENHQVYFCTITCYRWLSLFDLSEGYDLVYQWFDHLKSRHCHISGYVIMPNHLHALLFPTEGSLNKLVANGKRFMAYGIVDRLVKKGQSEMLNQLKAGVQAAEIKKGKKHQVFRLSFDARACFDEPMIEQKLDYIHHNPVSGKWSLVEDYTKYVHSSAGYYQLGMENKYVTHYKELGSYVA